MMKVLFLSCLRCLMILEKKMLIMKLINSFMVKRLMVKCIEDRRFKILRKLEREQN